MWLSFRLSLSRRRSGEIASLPLERAPQRLLRSDFRFRRDTLLIELTDEMRESLASALADRLPVTVCYVDGDGQPQISFRGTTQVHSSDQLAIWARNPNGGLPNAIGEQPLLSLLYRNPEAQIGWQFQGRAHVDESEEARNAIFDASPEAEQNRDPEREGVAIVIDVDRVIARGQVLMQR